MNYSRSISRAIVFSIGMLSVSSSSDAILSNADMSRNVSAAAQVVHDIILPGGALATSPNLAPIKAVFTHLYNLYGGFGVAMGLQSANASAEVGYETVVKLIAALPQATLVDLFGFSFADGATLVHYAALNNQADFIKAIGNALPSARVGAMFAAVDLYGNTPLHYAALGTTDPWPTMKALLDKTGKLATISTNNNCLMSPIHCAVLASALNWSVAVEGNLNQEISFAGSPTYGDWTSVGGADNQYGLTKTLDIPIIYTPVRGYSGSIPNASAITNLSIAVSAVESGDKSSLVAIKIGSSVTSTSLPIPGTVAINSTLSLPVAPSGWGTPLIVDIPIVVVVTATASTILVSVSNRSYQHVGAIALREIVDGYVASNSMDTKSKAAAAIKTLTGLFAAVDVFGHSPIGYSNIGNGTLQWVILNIFMDYYNQSGQMAQAVKDLEASIKAWKADRFYINGTATTATMALTLLRDPARLIFYAFPGVFVSEYTLAYFWAEKWARY